LDLSFPGGLLFAQLGSAPLFAGLLIILVGAQFFLHPASLDEFLEPPQCLTYRFFVVYPHAQTHSASFVRPCRDPGTGFLGIAGPAVVNGYKNPDNRGNLE